MTRHRVLPLLLAPFVVLAVACGSDAPSSATTAAVSTAVSSSPSADGCPAPDGSSPKQTQFDAAPPMCLTPGTTYVATITTNHGTIHATLDQAIAPETVNSFVYLARNHYFDDTPCHRAIPGFVVQCGDPTGTGTGGPGYETPVEIDPNTTYAIGDLAMAKRRGATTNGSQFFIISGDDGAALPPEYSLFGKVDPADLGVVATLDALGNPDPSAGGVPPKEPITIQSVTIAPAI